MKIHAIQTGVVRVRPVQVYGGNMLQRLFQILLSKQWSEWMPIYCWLIEQKGEYILVDTGETAKINSPNYLPNDFLYHRVVQTKITQEDELNLQLSKIGIETKEIKKIILTHLHGDHVGGLYHFPHAEILVSRREYELANSKKGPKKGYFNYHWPEQFKPILIDYENVALPPFNKSKEAWPDTNIFLVPTPGHTEGHLSVIIKELKVIISGDATFNKLTLQKEIPDFPLPNKAGFKSVAQLKAFINENDFQMLSSHDFEAIEILKNLNQ